MESTSINGISMTCKCGAKFTVRNDDLGYLDNDSHNSDGSGRYLIMEKIADRWLRQHKECTVPKASTNIEPVLVTLPEELK